MITLDQYFGSFGHTQDHVNNAEILLNRVNLLLEDAKKYGVVIKINSKTNCEISGTIYGGFRPLDTGGVGAPNSSHKEAMGVDIYDIENNSLDGFLDDIKLLRYDLYRESADKTPNWVHLTTRPPRSGKRTFLP